MASDTLDRRADQSDRRGEVLAEMPPIIGIGASAGGLEALTQLLHALPAAPGLAIVVVQHLAAKHQSALPELLADVTSMRVEPVTEGMRLAVDHVYVIPPNTQLRLEGDSLRLTPRPQDQPRHLPIDVFFSSLAKAVGERAIGVVLSGTGSDGAQGLGEIKSVGGITIAQDPKTAAHAGMPQAAIQRGVVDLILSPGDIAAELLRLTEHPYLSAPTLAAEQVPPSEAQAGRSEELMELLRFLRQKTGVDFAQYKPGTIQRRIERRMTIMQVGTMTEYLSYLRENPQEVEQFFHDVFIHVTRFFRDPESFRVLRERVLKPLVEQRRAEPIRIWDAGCASGEEPYSVAMELLEVMAESGHHQEVQIFATDISEPAIETARAGIYPESIEADVPAAYLERYFTKHGDGYHIGKGVRDLCIFAVQDLTRDPPFSRVDLVVCRNVLIYMDQSLQTRLLGLFHYALNTDGFLLLGEAEGVGSGETFEAADKKHRMYRKRTVRRHMDLVARGDPGARSERPYRRRTRSSAARSGDVQQEATQRILERYSPPGVIVDGEMQITQFRGKTGRFLEHEPGDASLDLLRLVRSSLAAGLRSAIQEAQQQRQAVRRERIAMRVDGTVSNVDLQVIPLQSDEEQPSLLVLFEEHAALADIPDASHDGAESSPVEDGDTDGVVRQLQQELADTRAYLRAIVQDLEAANEELQSANEEALSSNEELQSTNEELDTAKEELQSNNEELATVNDELHARNDDLSRINSDLTNLLGSVQIPIAIVDRDLRIRRFTPAAQQVLNLIGTDVGRPIGHLRPNLDIPNLESLIRDVINSVIHVEREVRDDQGRWYALTIRPYQDMDNRIDGAVVVLQDIDSAKRHEAVMERARAYAEAIIDTIGQPLLVLDDTLRVQKVNVAFERMFALPSDAMQGRSIFSVGEGMWDTPALRELLERVLPAEEIFERFVLSHAFPVIGERTLLLNGRRLEPGYERAPLVLVTIEDITDRPATDATPHAEHR